ncbi:MAG TPA: tetratricopeptide repeat protein [Vicinamibacterales bacterium]|nr:tetratricopeptide repeat protein [Vicinamibacterales bacterium]
MRTTMLRGAFAFAVLLAVSASPAMAQNLVRGVVFDPQNKPVEGATVHFEGQGFVNKSDTKTDRRGEFLFQGLPSGDYVITASKDGVGTASQMYMVTSNSAKEKLTFDLRPETKAPTPAAAAAAAAVVTNPTLEAIRRGVNVPSNANAEAKKEAAAVQATATAALDAQKAGQHEEAISKFNEVLGKVPGCSDCYVYIGTSYYELKKYAEAETALKKSIEVKPTVEGYTQLARTYNTQKKFDLAAEASSKAADLANNVSVPAAAPGAAGGAAAAAAPAPSANSETLYNQGVILWNSGKYAEAKERFDAAVKANPGNAAAQYQLGMANLNLGQLPAARAAFEAYLKAEPDGNKAAEVKTFLAQLPK